MVVTPIKPPVPEPVLLAVKLPVTTAFVAAVMEMVPPLPPLPAVTVSPFGAVTELVVDFRLIALPVHVPLTLIAFVAVSSSKVSLEVPRLTKDDVVSVTNALPVLVV